MNNYLLVKYLINLAKEYIFIFLITSIFVFFSFTKSYGEENLFTINNVKVKGAIDLNFSREKYLNKAFLNSFDLLMHKILLTRDLEKVSSVKLTNVKKLIRNFQIVEESFRKEEYEATIKIVYSEKKIKNFLSKKNISFSHPENISSVFFPVLYINDEIQSLNENFFYTQWNQIEISNEIVNFVLPLEDLEDISKIAKFRNNIEDINAEELVNKYNINNYVFALMEYRKKKLNVYLEINFNNNETRKNIVYEVKNIKDEIILNSILKDLKLKIIDFWKEENLVNLLMPLSINIKFQHMNLKELDKLSSIFSKISIIDNYSLEEFNINNSFYKIYYYSNPKKLRSELLKFGYQLRNDQGFWQIYFNE